MAHNKPIKRGTAKAWLSSASLHKFSQALSAPYWGVMSNMKFKYFRDPENFSFKIDDPAECSVCGNVGLWYDAGGFYGLNEIECICDECLLEGKLKELEIETNEAIDGSEEDKEEVIYKTPALPVWQSRLWPTVSGQYCIFERMASKADFQSKQEFMDSVMPLDREGSDLDWLWEAMPDKKIKNHREGNFNVSVYLFTLMGKKYTTWDAS
ncbi:hypothetical protein tloyanaT_15860 [Thalassotalea loyana]|uniref:CbrC family protein n=1 Tax=Thalassotalea loyana TaxID=280483 RepID=A0ABQ6HBH1_9GAMM|nr:CbrC family protein [Thalassotalea loyana]GLX85334.1 hypothetical protein tloyanaT_15860 [Thalassotalea loyana]